MQRDITIFRWHGSTPVATRMGYIPIKRLKVGDLVWTLDQQKNKIQTPIVKIGKQNIEGKRGSFYEILPKGTGVYWVGRKMVRSSLWTRKRRFNFLHIPIDFFKFERMSFQFNLLNR